MAYRIYIDESGTHAASSWFIIGALFVPDHGIVHSELCAVKERLQYFNKSPKIKARYKEIHFKKFRNQRDVQVAQEWIRVFLKHSCFYRAIVIDWSIYDGRYFGDPFDPDSLKKRRAYKKWAEMLLHPEFTQPVSGELIRNAELYMDKLRILHGYDVIDWLKERFLCGYQGSLPYVAKFQHADAAKDENQCLQLCDLLTSTLYQELMPSTRTEKIQVRDYLKEEIKHLGVNDLSPRHWKGFDKKTLRNHFPKYSVWFWRPDSKATKRRIRKMNRLK